MHEDDGIVVVFAGGGTGGHLYPALAIADALVALRPDVQPFFVGAEERIEATVYPRRGVEHVLLPVRGLDRARPWRNAGVLWDLARSTVRLARLFRWLEPKAVVVTGGFAAAPAGLLARPFRLPLVIQEANSYPGVTNRRLARHARIIHLAFPEAREHLPPAVRDRAVISGNPIRPPGHVDPSRARAAFGLQPGSTVLLVVGGSQGSRAINALLLDAVRAVADGTLTRPSGLEVLWATGTAHYDAVSSGLAELGSPGWVKAVDYLHRMPEALSAADLAISRAGALSTSEFLAWGIPAVMIPLPTSAQDHQRRNARTLEAAGAGVCLDETGLDAEALWSEVTALTDDPERLAEMARHARERGEPDAAARIARSIEALLPPYAGGPGGPS